MIWKCLCILLISVLFSLLVLILKLIEPFPHFYFVLGEFSNSQGSGKSVHMRRLVWPLTACTYKIEKLMRNLAWPETPVFVLLSSSLCPARQCWSNTSKRPDMTKNLLIGTKSINSNKYKNYISWSSWFHLHVYEICRSYQGGCIYTWYSVYKAIGSM